MSESWLERDNRNNERYMCECPLCLARFRYGNQIYQGQYLKGYQLRVCDTCYCLNEDGWSKNHNPFLLERCREIGVEPPPLDVNGFLPRDFDPQPVDTISKQVGVNFS